MRCAQSEYITMLQYQVKGLSAQLEAFRSGSKFQQMNADFRALERTLDRERKKFQAELSRAHAEAIDVRNKWFQVFEDLEKEHADQLADRDREIARLRKRILEAERQRDAALDKVAEQRLELYKVKTQLEEEKGKNLNLRAQINRDSENSSIPSSLKPNRRPVQNSRECSGRKPGGQPGHAGHGRQRQAPARPVVKLPVPREALDDPDFRKTDRTITKQMVSLRVSLDVTEYAADVYYNSKTGERIHAAFPKGVVNDVNYDGTIRAFLFLLTDHCNVSIDRAKEFLKDITDGRLKISKGMVSSLRREFARKTEAEKKKTFADLLLKPVLHTDCTNASVNGKPAYVFVCISPDGTVQYYARENKGHKGVAGTPIEDYQGILVHDHEMTFYKYGSDHQECNAHILRYLKDSIQNEPDRTWSTQMRSLVQEMIHYRNSLGEDEEPDAMKVKEFEDRYRKVLKTAEDEYTDVPPNEYYREGYNLYKRMVKFMHSHLLFLHDKNLPTNNNVSERCLRSYKRKQKQVITLRSFTSLEDICQNMGTLQMLRDSEEENLFNSVAGIFSRTIEV